MINPPHICRSKFYDMRTAFLFALALMAIGACNNAADQAGERKDGFSVTAGSPEDSLYRLVMEGHDVGMAKMGKIRQAQKTTQQAMDSLNKLPANETRERLQQALMDLQEDLNYAEYSMNTWMEEFKADSLQDSPESRLAYLKTEQEKVEKVKTAILESLRMADSVLKK